MKSETPKLKFHNFAIYVRKQELIECGTLFKESRDVQRIRKLSSMLINDVLNDKKYGFTHKTQISRDLSSSGFVLGNKI